MHLLGMAFGTVEQSEGVREGGRESVREQQ